MDSRVCPGQNLAGQGPCKRDMNMKLILENPIPLPTSPVPYLPGATHLIRLPQAAHPRTRVRSSLAFFSPRAAFGLADNLAEN